MGPIFMQLRDFWMENLSEIMKNAWKNIEKKNAMPK